MMETMRPTIYWLLTALSNLRCATAEQVRNEMAALGVRRRVENVRSTIVHQVNAGNVISAMIVHRPGPGAPATAWTLSNQGRRALADETACQERARWVRWIGRRRRAAQ